MLLVFILKETSKNTLMASQAFNLKLEINGNGNLMLFELPEPTLPASLEVYDPEHSENIKTSLWRKGLV